MKTQLTGTATGVPFVVEPPAEDRADAPVVVAWHLLDAPRTERAFAAALPLAGLDAWRIYLGLPLTGARMPSGGMEEVMRLGYEDAVMNLYRPITTQAVAEFPAAFADLRERFGFEGGPLAFLGGSQGAAVAQLALLAGDVPDVAAMVLVSPVTRLRAVVEANKAVYGFTYPWHPAALDAAAELDFVARAGETAQRRPAVRLVVGEDDHRTGILEPARQLQVALSERYADPARADLVTVPGMGHALADEPGLEPAPQLPHAAAVDRLAVEWLRRHLDGAGGRS
jgi:pimeloyl-ACP methyl ester carboxylesterase